ncbi:hypothetical protein MPSEU_000777600 [Mayamaea pseudoterrestris]|nr:hypothetical protein MPSEU_000777600 [Mayamaea pseudoterrestris]
MTLTPPKLEFVEASETSLTVQFPPPPASVKVLLQWKEHACPSWEQGGSMNVSLATAQEKLVVTADSLEPGKSYQLRLVYTKAGTDAAVEGPEVVLDTEQVGCTPKADKGCCVLQ